MGGIGSGGHNRLSDEEKKRKGTFRADYSDAAWDAKAAAKIITGPWLTSIPEPQMPFGKIGMAKYREFADLLLKGNKLTKVTCDDCERYAILWEQMHELKSAKKKIPMQMINRMDALAVRLRVAENAPAIADPNEKSRFSGAGFSNSRTSPYRLRSTGS